MCAMLFVWGLLCFIEGGEDSKMKKLKRSWSFRKYRRVFTLAFGVSFGWPCEDDYYENNWSLAIEFLLWDFCIDTYLE